MRRRETAAAAEGNQRVTARKPMAAFCLRRTQIITALADSEPQAPGGGFREVRRGELTAETARTHATTKRKQRADSCRLRSVRYHYPSDGAGLAGVVASAVTERSMCGCLMLYTKLCFYFGTNS